MRNNGKKRVWTCEHVEHYYDDFVNTHLCHAIGRKMEECAFRGNMMKMQECPMFKRGDFCCYVKKDDAKEIS